MLGERPRIFGVRRGSAQLGASLLAGPAGADAEYGVFRPNREVIAEKLAAMREIGGCEALDQEAAGRRTGRGAGEGEAQGGEQADGDERQQPVEAAGPAAVREQAVPPAPALPPASSCRHQARRER